MQPDKTLVKRRFADSFESYRDHASIQKNMATRLFDLIEQRGYRDFKRALEIGCHAGTATRAFADRFGYESLILNDLVEECAALTGEIARTRFIPGDAETVDLPDSLDLAFSNAAFQWMADLPGLLDKLAERLNPGGLLLFSTFGPENFREIRELTGVALEYPRLERLAETVERRFEILEARDALEIPRFEGPLRVLRHMRDTGVTGLSGRGWARSETEAFLSSYADSFGAADGTVPLTYHPIWILAREKEGRAQ